MEGYTPDALQRLSPEELDPLLFTGEPILFRAGSAEILGQFRLGEGVLEVELAQIEGGGEGVLPTLWMLAERLAQARGCTRVEWTVHAANCARPNPKLRPLLERRGFQLRPTRGGALAYCFSQAVSTAEREADAMDLT